MVSVRGKDRFVVVDVAFYQHLREYELEMTLPVGLMRSAADHA